MQFPGIPIEFRLNEERIVTLALEAGRKKHVVTLLNAVRVPAGKHRVIWDGLGPPEWKKHGYVRRNLGLHRYKVKLLTFPVSEPEYVMSAGNSGKLPAFDPLASTAWLSDHCPPSAVLFLPPVRDKSAQIVVASVFAGRGDGLVWLTPQGEKLFGCRLDGWAGARCLARDRHPSGATPFDFLTLTIWHGKRDAQGKILDHGWVVISGIKDRVKYHLAGYQPKQAMIPFNGIRYRAGLAVFNGVVAHTDPIDGKLYVFRFSGEKLVRKAVLDLPDAGGCAFDEQGNFYYIQGTSVWRGKLKSAGNRIVLSEKKELISRDLEAPQQLTLWNDRIFVSDWGHSHQVKVFDVEGKLVQKIGHPGGPQVGLYDPMRMHYPFGITVDDAGILWVAENDYLPKRLSRWDAIDGTFIDAFYGPPQKEGGGFIDPLTPSRFFYAHQDPYNSAISLTGTMMFEIDWEKRTSRLAAIPLRSAEPVERPNGEQCQRKWLTMPKQVFPGWTAPCRTLHWKGKLFLTDAGHAGSQRFAPILGVWYMKRNLTLIPILSAGFVGKNGENWAPWKRRDLQKLLPPPDKTPWEQIFYLWRDLDFDQQVSKEEIMTLAMPWHPRRKSSSHVWLGDDFSILTSSFFKLPCLGCEHNGMLEYDFQIKKFVLPVDLPYDWKIVQAGSWYTNGTVGIFKGALRWQLPISYNSDITGTLPGMMERPRNIIGPPYSWKRNDGSYEELFIQQLNSGKLVAMTADGLPAAVWDSCRIPGSKQKLPFLKDAKFASFCPVPDMGEYVITGVVDSQIIRLPALRELDRESWVLELDDSQIRAIPKEVSYPKPWLNRTTVIPRLDHELTVDGDARDWPEFPEAWADLQGLGRFRLAVDSTYLYGLIQCPYFRLAFDPDATPWNRNSRVYANGNSIDFFLRTTPENVNGYDHVAAVRESDRRVLLSQDLAARSLFKCYVQPKSMQTPSPRNIPAVTLAGIRIKRSADITEFRIP
ncbi:MAG: hypothetical protein D6820_18780, partial [Lentisphaerae bacterium]